MLTGFEPLRESKFDLWMGDAAGVPHEAGAEVEGVSSSCRTAITAAGGESLFTRSGYPIGRIEICDNCCGTGTGWSVAHADHESFAYGSLNEP